MNIDGKTVLVTGANRGLGRAFAEAFLATGAARVYAGARDPATVADARLIPLQLDVTSADDVRAAAESCADIDILVNNAGVMLATNVMDENSEQALAEEMAVNVYGTLAMAKAFAPVLRNNGGGAIVNMLSVVSWFVNPANPTYCASKHAALAITDALRIELKAQGTHVMGVYAGYIDTDMGAALTDGPMTPPEQVAQKTIEGLRAGVNHVLAGESAENTWRAMREDPEALHARMQAVWDAAHPAAD